ncbi:MAG: MerR family transcriptional regulator [Eubacterium sp.]|nr:MerR family transcriptional regulator [Eubacterium sp.]MCM1218651.1 MerR family transcriptional regulator [Lachnospiraceae bacterium]MCM1305156.1 MerR family transcriptional regulator [Butyrivibrio sp.]MCM1344571.1 MerR family transcriptional regulator [Muribaculaceae bacterium]MCM1239183.1 MerR family transcriptional regulator [Lachnospiraceae bacterium]
MDDYLFISDAAKEVKVESHVLRYWEEELHLPIKRNELGHRYYTEEDVERFKQIKGMKERGLQLKAIKMILKDGKLDMLVPKQKAEENAGKDMPPANMPIDIVETKETAVSTADSKEDKSRRLQWLLQQLIRETLQENNSELCREIKESVVKELDYQFRMQEEREEARDKLLAERSEEHYRKMDELLRKKARKKGLREKTKEKAEPSADKNLLEHSGEEMPKGDIFDESLKEKQDKKKKRFIF